MHYPAAADTAPTDFPTVVMAEIPGLTPNDPELYKAIQAQLSAAPLRLYREKVASPQPGGEKPFENALKLSKKRGAAVVFWIVDNGATCTLIFFNSAAADGKLHRRVLDLASGSQLSRYENIGNAAASVIEDAVSGLKIEHKSAPEPATKPTSPPTQNPSEQNRKWVELFAGYAGTLFADTTVTNGVHMGLGLFPGRHTAVLLSYTQDLPLHMDTAQYRFTLSPRNLEASLAGRILFGAIDVRLGLAWSVDLRSISTDAVSSEITPRAPDLEGIHSLMPFASLTWTFQDRFGFSAEVGADIALNEREYKILREDDSEISVLRPYMVKLMYRFGLVVHL